MPLHSEVTPAATKPHEVDPRSKSDKRPKFGKLIKPDEYPVKATGDTGKTDGVTLIRSELVHGADTGEAAKLNKFPESRARETSKMEVDVPPETVEKYANFLEGYVRNLGKMAEEPPPPGTTVDNLLEYVLQDPNRRADKLLIDQLSQQAVAKDGTTITRTVNTDRVKDYLQTADGWAETTMAMEQYALMIQMGLGMAAAVDAKPFHGQTSGAHDGDSLVLTQDTRTLRSLIKTGASKTAAAIVAGGYMIGGKGRTDVDMKMQLEILDELKNSASPAERAYLRAMAGIDIDRITITAGGGGLEASYDTGYQPDIRDLESRVKNCYSARKEFFSKLGVDAPGKPFRGREIDRTRNTRTPDEAIFFDDVREEGLQLRYLMEISKEEGDLLAAFGGTPSRFERARMKAEAREKVRIRYAERRIAMEQTKKEAGSLDALKKKREQMVNNADAFRKEKAEKHTKNKEEAEKKKATAETKKKALTEGPDAVAAREQAVTNLERNLIREYNLPLDADVPSAIEGKRKGLTLDLETAQKDLDKALKDRADESRKLVVDDIVKPLTASLDKFSAAVGGAKTVTPPNFDINAIAAPGLEAINTKYDTLINRLSAKVEGAENQLSNLEAQYQAYVQAAGERDSATTELAAGEPDQFNKSAVAIDAFIGGLVPLATLAEVRTKSVEDLVALLPTGTDEEKLEQTLLAKATEETDRLVALSTIQVASITALTTAGIDYDQFLVVSPRELFDRLRNYNFPPPAVPTAAEVAIMTQQIDTASQAAGKSMRVLNETRLKQEIAYYDGVIKAEEKSLKALGDFKEPIVELDSAIAIMEDVAEGRTYSMAYEVANDKDETVLRGLADAVVVDPTDTKYSEAERKLGVEKGAFAWYELLYPEYKNSPDRDKIFASLTRLLPPAKLSNLIAEGYFNLPPGPPIPLAMTLGAINVDITAGIVTGPKLQRTVRHILDHVREHGLAL